MTAASNDRFLFDHEILKLTGVFFSKNQADGEVGLFVPLSDTHAFLTLDDVFRQLHSLTANDLRLIECVKSALETVEKIEQGDFLPAVHT